MAYRRAVYAGIQKMRSLVLLFAVDMVASQLVQIGRFIGCICVQVPPDAVQGQLHGKELALPCCPISLAILRAWVGECNRAWDFCNHQCC